MKRAIFLFFALFLTFQCYSQQRYSGQWVMKVAGGVNVSSLGFVTELGTEYIFTRGSSLHLTALYNRNFYSSVTDSKVCVDNIGGMIHYAYTLLPTQVFRISILGGLFVTDQSLPANIEPGVVINATSKVDFGLSFAGQLDISLASHLSLYLQPTLNYHILSDIDNFSFLTNLGFKIYF